MPHANMTLGNTSETSLTSPPKKNVPRAEAEVNTIHEETAVARPTSFGGSYSRVFLFTGESLSFIIYIAVLLKVPRELHPGKV